MEKDYNRDKGPYRPKRSDSRDDSRPRRSDSRDDSRVRRDERPERPAYGERPERKEDTRNRYANNRTERSSDRGQNSAPRSFNRERRESTGNNYQPRESRDERESYPRRDDRGTTGNSYQQRERRDDRESYPRRESFRGDARAPRTFRERSDSNSDEKRGDGERKVLNKRRDSGREYPRNRREISGEAKDRLRESHYSKKKILAHRLKNMDENAELRLNRFISMGGVCSRRDADQLIADGRVKVNGEPVAMIGMKVYRSDKVEVDGEQIFPEKKVYLVLNKPKDYVTTVEDPLNRKTVMALIKGACKERVYPVGRLDRQTTGVLLFTNDGDLAKKLTHPKYDSKKIYHAFLDKPMSETDLNTISKGVDLEDGFIKADEISYASTDKMEVGLEIHSGKNRIVRRIFEHLGYEIIKLDRVYFSGITKKNIPRGKWRMLTPKEVNMLKIY